jgi:hypothetical protein
VYQPVFNSTIISLKTHLTNHCCPFNEIIQGLRARPLIFRLQCPLRQTARDIEGWWMLPSPSLIGENIVVVSFIAI